MMLELGLAGVVIYLIPSAVAFMRGHPSGWAILALNLLLGWCVIGWVIALVWSLTSRQPVTTEPRAAARSPSNLPKIVLRSAVAIGALIGVSVYLAGCSPAMLAYDQQQFYAHRAALDAASGFDMKALNDAQTSIQQSGEGAALEGCISSLAAAGYPNTYSGELASICSTGVSHPLIPY